MSIETIVGGKGRSVVTITPDRTVADAARLLSEHRIGAVVVVDGGGRVAGILSERDIVKAVSTRGEQALAQPVSAEMTAEVVTCGPTAGLDELMGIMTTRKFRHIPVVVGGRLEGIVSIGDLVKARLAEIEAEHKAMKDYIAAG